MDSVRDEVLDLLVKLAAGKLSPTETTDAIMSALKRGAGVVAKEEPLLGVERLVGSAPLHRITSAVETSCVVTDDMGLRYLTQVSVSRAMRWHPGGLEEWSLSDWGVALAGEMGELCDVIKKLNRDRDGAVGNKKTREELLRDLADEAHDVLAYLVLLCARAEIDLVDASVSKFNQVSKRNGFPERLTAALSSRTEEEVWAEVIEKLKAAADGRSVVTPKRGKITILGSGGGECEPLADWIARSLTNGGE